jgi:polyhydroxyalkanoate synthase subunit PhaE
MHDKKQEPSGPESLLGLWLKTAASFWESGLPSKSEAGTAETSTTTATAGARRTLESFEASLKTWQTLSAMMREPDAMESMVKGVHALPEVVAKMMKPAMEGFFHLQQEWMERVGRIGKSTAAYDFENMDQEAFRAWLEIYENEFRRFLNIPQLGLTRSYQERFTQAADKFNIFQATAAEFLSVLYLPVEKSFKVMQKQLAAMADEGKIPEKSKELYRLWVKILEGHYMTLFKSPEYAEALRRILDALGEFNVSRQQILQDALQSFPIPTLKEMDEFYKEIYLLKKRVRELEKKHNGDGTNVNRESPSQENNS